MNKRSPKVGVIFAFLSMLNGLLLGLWGWKIFPQTSSGIFAYAGIQEVFFIGIPALVLTLRRKEHLYMLFKKPDPLSSGLVMLASVSFSLAAVLVSGIWITLLDSMGINVPLQNGLPKAESPMLLALAILMAAIIPAFSEEIMFRGLLHNFLSSKLHQRTANILTALLFTLIHFSIQGFAALFVIGLFLSLIMSRHQSLWLCILFHAVYNVMVLILQSLNSLPSVQLFFLCLGIFLGVWYLLFHKWEASVWN